MAETRYKSTRLGTGRDRMVHGSLVLKSSASGFMPIDIAGTYLEGLHNRLPGEHPRMTLLCH